jgi:hypothetical protein
VLTNSWKGSALIHRVVVDLQLLGPASDPTDDTEAMDGTYALGSTEAVVAEGSITEIEHEPLTGAPLERRYPLSIDAPLMSWRSDFPRPGVARIGWVALPRSAGPDG